MANSVGLFLLRFASNAGHEKTKHELSPPPEPPKAKCGKEEPQGICPPQESNVGQYKAKNAVPSRILPILRSLKAFKKTEYSNAVDTCVCGKISALTEPDVKEGHFSTKPVKGKDEASGQCNEARAVETQQEQSDDEKGGESSIGTRVPSKSTFVNPSQKDIASKFESKLLPLRPPSNDNVAKLKSKFLPSFPLTDDKSTQVELSDSACMCSAYNASVINSESKFMPLLPLPDEKTPHIGVDNPIPSEYDPERNKETVLSDDIRSSDCQVHDHMPNEGEKPGEAPTEVSRALPNENSAEDANEHSDEDSDEDLNENSDEESDEDSNKDSEPHSSPVTNQLLGGDDTGFLGFIPPPNWNRLDEEQLRLFQAFCDYDFPPPRYTGSPPCELFTNVWHEAPTISNRDLWGLGLDCLDGCPDCDLIPNEMIRNKADVFQWLCRLSLDPHFAEVVWLNPDQHFAPSKIYIDNDEQDDNIRTVDEDVTDLLYGGTDCNEFKVLKHLHEETFAKLKTANKEACNQPENQPDNQPDNQPSNSPDNEPEDEPVDEPDEESRCAAQVVIDNMLRVESVVDGLPGAYYGPSYNIILAEYEPSYLPSFGQALDKSRTEALLYPVERDPNQPIWEARGKVLPGIDEAVRMEYTKKEYRRQWIMYHEQDDSRRRYIEMVCRDAEDELIMP